MAAENNVITIGDVTPSTLCLPRIHQMKLNVNHHLGHWSMQGPAKQGPCATKPRSTATHCLPPFDEGIFEDPGDLLGVHSYSSPFRGTSCHYRLINFFMCRGFFAVVVINDHSMDTNRAWPLGPY